MEDTRLPKCVMFGDSGGGRGLRGGSVKRIDGMFPGRHRAFVISVDQWKTAAQDEGNGARWRNKGRNVS